MNDILIKPPIFIKNIVNTLTEDLKEKKSIYKGEYDKLSVYLNNKYYSKMPRVMRLTTLKALWKLCFCLPDDEDCKSNRLINRKALEILVDGFQQEAFEYIKANSNYFYVAPSETCALHLAIFLSKFPPIYHLINQDTVLQVNTTLEKDMRGRAVAWFRFDTPQEHLEDLLSVPYLKLESGTIKRLITYYSDIGKFSILLDFFIEYYGNSGNYDSADDRFDNSISPYIYQMSHDQLVRLIEVTNDNRQIYNRGASRMANDKIVCSAKKVLGKGFDYSQYPHFKFTLEPTSEEEQPEEKGSEGIEDDELPF